MIDIQIADFADGVPATDKTYRVTVILPAGYKVTGGGGSVLFTPGAIGATCSATITDNIPMPGYGPNGEDGWRFGVLFSNTNRGAATVTVRAIGLAELPEPVPAS